MENFCCSPPPPLSPCSPPLPLSLPFHTDLSPHHAQHRSPSHYFWESDIRERCPLCVPHRTAMSEDRGASSQLQGCHAVPEGFSPSEFERERVCLSFHCLSCLCLSLTLSLSLPLSSLPSSLPPPSFPPFSPSPFLLSTISLSSLLPPPSAGIPIQTISRE